MKQRTTFSYPWHMPKQFTFFALGELYTVQTVKELKFSKQPLTTQTQVGQLPKTFSQTCESF